MRSVRIVSRGSDAGPYIRLPDGEVDLIVRVTPANGYVHAIGTRLHALHKSVVDVPQTIAVRFKPGGAYPFFGVPMSELTDRIVSIDTLWGADGTRLRHELAEAPSIAARMQVLEDALTERLRRGDVFEPASAHVVRRAIRVMTDATEPPRVEVLARELGLSARQLRRAFDEVVGVSPKEFARVVRFQRAVRASERAATPDWGAIAAAVGYYDQAHLISDFRALTGTTPSAFVRARARAESLQSVSPG
ncbi:AraC family transcriptional regulator [Vitiosangium sp. GDMCC 1.1324]|nr:AraC family transcriptional regulator [Vitiosangium sp. GDMCC 1.1324]